MRHILIVGRNGVGKSTLIRALTDRIPAPVYGVITKKEAPYPDGSCPIYIHTYGAQRRYDEENRIGLCREGSSRAFPEAFDRFAHTLRFPSDGVIVLDELGFLESSAHAFTRAILRLLDDAPVVIAAVRDKQTPFLDAVRSHPRADIYRVDPENRNELRETLIHRLPALLPELFSGS